IDALFNFDPNAEPAPKDKNGVTAEILTCTVYNQTVADNTADILKGARIMLSYGIFTTIISCVFFLGVPVIKDENKVYHTKVTLADTSLRNAIINTSVKKDSAYQELEREIRKLSHKMDSLTKPGKTQGIRPLQNNSSK
ncbi:MAG TPA: hypothetical protein VNY73_06015, partial [Bacteroidia bacterium]|nr:hypothetical protein [Bacteroidia bacterium]